MMGSGAFAAIVAGIKFVARGRYDRRAALGLCLGGLPGVAVAVWLVTSLPLGHDSHRRHFRRDLHRAQSVSIGRDRCARRRHTRRRTAAAALTTSGSRPAIRARQRRAARADIFLPGAAGSLVRRAGAVAGTSSVVVWPGSVATEILRVLDRRRVCGTSRDRRDRREPSGVRFSSSRRVRRPCASPPSSVRADLPGTSDTSCAARGSTNGRRRGLRRRLPRCR